MSLIKRKLGSKAGASMLLALVFLMFCLFIGGSVLAAATANGSRVAHLKNDQQDYLSQRSAMLLMADMLTGKDGKPLNITITDMTANVFQSDGITLKSNSRTATFDCSNLDASPNVLQKMLLECIVINYDSGASKDYSKFNLSLLDTSGAFNGTIQITDPINNERFLTAKYEITSEYDLSITFEFPSGSDDSSFFSLAMHGQVNPTAPMLATITNEDKTITKTATTVTSITWEKPTVNKGGA